MTTMPDRSTALAAMAAQRDADAEASSSLPALTGDELGDGDVTRLVVSARFPFIDSAGGYQFANRGDIVHITAEQADRGESLDALVDPDNPPTAGEDPTGGKTDEELGALSAPALVSWVNSHPEQLDRVRALEEAREEPRVTVTRTLDRLEEARGTQADTEAEEPVEELDEDETP